MRAPEMVWPLSVPVLSDGVVTLRAHTPTDVDGLYEMAVDPEMVRWTAVATPHTREMSEQFALAIIPRGWDEGTNRIWAIEAEGRFAGNVDIRQGPIGDIGFALHPWARGKGLMARAVRLAIDWAFTEGGFEIVHWRSHVGNEASLRIAHATGFALHGTIPGSLNERGMVLDAWAASIRFGDAPLATTPWAESTVLESERVRLRPMNESDLPRIVEACSDPVTQQWLSNLPSPYSVVDARAFLADSVWQAAKGAKATWAVADRTSDELIGTIAVMDMLRPGTGEIGYWMHPDARGKGLMTEAARLTVEHAWSGLDRRRLVLYAADGNVASNRVAAAAGFTRYGTQHRAERLGDGTYVDLHGYELLKLS